MKRTIIMLILVAFVMTSCQSNSGIVNDDKEADDKSEIVIGATLASEDSVYLDLLSGYMKLAARERAVMLDLVYADWNVELQTRQIEDFIAQGVDAIILNPVNAKSMLGSLKMAEQAGIPVINLNMKVDGISTEYIDTYVGASMSEEAVLAGELVLDILGEEGGQVAIIEGAPGNDAQIYRTQTLMEYLIPHPRVAVVGMGNGGWDRRKAYLVAWDLIKNNPQLEVIYAHDSNMAMGAIEAIDELEKTGTIQVIGIGEDPEYLQAIKDGRLYGLVTQPPDYEGKYSVYCAIMAANGETLRPWYKNPVQIITKDNVDDYKLQME